MPKYTYKPVLDVVHSDWTTNTQVDFPVTDELLNKVRLVVDVENEEDAEAVRMPITNIRAWELVED